MADEMRPLPIHPDGHLMGFFALPVLMDLAEHEWADNSMNLTNV